MGGARGGEGAADREESGGPWSWGLDTGLTRGTACWGGGELEELEGGQEERFP